VADALAQAKLPGCVVAIGRQSGIIFLHAFGFRSVLPEKEPMTEDTVFDLASLTKPIATATSLMVLADQGKIDLDDRASRYVPEFAARGKSAITIRQLLTHVSGLPSETALDDYEHGRAEAIRRIAALSLKAAPGTRFTYSDIGFLILEEVVRRVTGTDLASFAETAVFRPLGMKQTGFLPSSTDRTRIAPTEQRKGAWIRGEVHDPRAFRLGGVAGNAGLFSTAQDLARYARMLLGSGVLEDARVLSVPATAKMLAPHDVPGGIRALGWDMQSAYSNNRGTSLSRRAVGHGGYTGTSLWLDPEQDLFVIFLSNRVHPDGKGSINALAGAIATLAGSTLGRAVSEPPSAAALWPWESTPWLPRISPLCVACASPCSPTTAPAPATAAAPRMCWPRVAISRWWPCSAPSMVYRPATTNSSTTALIPRPSSLSSVSMVARARRAASPRPAHGR